MLHEEGSVASGKPSRPPARPGCLPCRSVGAAKDYLTLAEVKLEGNVVPSSPPPL